jgi:hypothetical protein
MPEIILSCPQCQRQLRVTEDLLGRPVRCPACQLAFTVPAENRIEPLAAVPVPPGERPNELPPYRDREEEFDDDTRDRPARRRPWDFQEADPARAKAQILPPAICLLVINILAALANLIMGLLWLVIPEQLMKMTAENPFMPQGAPQPPMQLMRVLQTTVEIGSFVVSVVVILAAIQMLRGRMFGLAVTGAILAMVNINHFCCILGVPAGIWALIVLLRPEGRLYFTLRNEPDAAGSGGLP